MTVLAHDVRNLLNPLSIRIALLSERAALAGRTEDLDECQRIAAGAQRIAELLSDLLDVARIEQGLLSLEAEAFDLVALVRETARALALPDVTVAVDARPDAMRVLGDRKRLRQALENVLSNAITHSPHGQSVAIQVRPARIDARDAASIAIMDRGPGIAPELLTHVFERYVASHKSSGLGLGLYLARAILAAHGGSISIASRAGSGTRCELVLPLSAST